MRLEELELGFLRAMWMLRVVAAELRQLGRKLTWICTVEAWFGAASASKAMEAPSRALPARREYVLGKKLAAGDLCDVYRASLGGEELIVKAPRVVSPAAHALLEKELRVLVELTQRGPDNHHALYYPQPVETLLAAAGGPRWNVLRWEEGFYTAGEILVRHPDGLDGRHLAWMFKRVLAALGHAHRQGWINGAVLPPHLLFHTENHGLHLAGWIHAVGLGEPLRLVPAAFREWYPPECKRGAGPATDIYLAAKSLVYLAGGDPLSNAIPDHVPRLMQSFLQSCLLESARMRPCDAWELHDELDELLAELYGPPQYVRLNMT